MKIKLWFKYLIFVVLIFLMITLRTYVTRQLTEQFRVMYRFNFYFLSIIMLINVGIGLLLGLEHLIMEIKKDGILKINLSKIILVALPSLYLSCTYFFVYSNNDFVQNILAYPMIKLLAYDSSFISVFQLILGYIVTTSFYKYSEKI